MSNDKGNKTCVHLVFYDERSSQRKEPHLNLLMAPLILQQLYPPVVSLCHLQTLFLPASHINTNANRHSIQVYIQNSSVKQAGNRTQAPEVTSIVL